MTEYFNRTPDEAGHLPRPESRYEIAGLQGSVPSTENCVLHDVWPSVTVEI
jgi:hypothetical protein